MLNKKALGKIGLLLGFIIGFGFFFYFLPPIIAQITGNAYFTIQIADSDLHQKILSESGMIPMKICNLQSTAKQIYFESIANKFPYDMQIWEVKNNSYIINDYSQFCSPYTNENLTLVNNCTNIINGSHTEYRLENEPFVKTTLAPNKVKNNGTTQNPNTCKDFYYKIKIPIGSSGEYNISVKDNEGNSYELDQWWNSTAT